MRHGLIGILLVWGCGSMESAVPVQPEDGEGARPAPPPLALTIHYDDPSSELGWGSFDLSARPMEHEFRVDLMVGAAVRTPRWRYCGAGELAIDGRHKMLPLRWSGVPMAEGLYDAVTVDITIEDVRAMSSAEHVEVEVCGDRVALQRSQLRDLGDFVRRFEEMATYDGPPAPAPPPPLDWEPSVPVVNGRATES